MRLKFKNHLLGLLSASTVLLTACGGGGGGTTTPPAAEPPPVVVPPPVITGSQTGILTDAAVQGVSYRTSSGVTGVTAADGAYNYNPGDTVQFTLGGLSLGNVSATGIISPIQLSGGDSNKLNNLLVMLQSLDTDGNPANGITIPTASAAAVPATVNLSQATNTFASSANTGLVTAMNAGGITRSVTSLASATAHFKEQGLVLLSSNVIVFYDNESAGMIRILPNGSYLMGQATPDDNCGALIGQCVNGLIGTAGSERGTATVTGFNTAGYQFSAQVIIDNNLQSGFSHPVPCDDGFLPNGEGFLINVAGRCTAEPVGEQLNKAPNNNATIVGVWALDSATSTNVQHFAFLPNGKFLTVDPVGDTSSPSCGGPGVEFGSYTWNTTNGQMAISNVTYDTNSCAGLFDLLGTRRIDVNGEAVATGVGTVRPAFNGTITLNAGGQTAAVIDSENPAPGLTLYRVSIDHAPRSLNFLD
jgi:hypothetical protein